MYRILFGKKNTAELVTKIADHVATNMTATGAEKVVVAEKAANATISGARISAKAAYARAGASVLSTGIATFAAYMYFKPVEDESGKLKAEITKLSSEKEKASLYIFVQDAKIDNMVDKIAEIKKILPEEYEHELKKIEKTSDRKFIIALQSLPPSNANDTTNDRREEIRP